MKPFRVANCSRIAGTAWGWLLAARRATQASDGEPLAEPRLP